MTRKPTWTITDHMCRECGGRVLQQESGGRPSGGGNPLYRCADCGVGACGMGPSVICWCGFRHRGQTEQAYMCLPFKGNESLLPAMARCGCVPGKHEIGVVLVNR
jgi:hypothetical protein